MEQQIQIANAKMIQTQTGTFSNALLCSSSSKTNCVGCCVALMSLAADGAGEGFVVPVSMAGSEALIGRNDGLLVSNTKVAGWFVTSESVTFVVTVVGGMVV